MSTVGDLSLCVWGGRKTTRCEKCILQPVPVYKDHSLELTKHDSTGSAGMSH